MMPLRGSLCGPVLILLQVVVTATLGGNEDSFLLDPQIDHVDRSGVVDPRLDLTQSEPSQRRRKRAWVIPPINIAENGKGPFPHRMAQIRSSNDEDVKILYKITGQGADQAPIGRFIIEKISGWLSVTEPLDRELQAQYIIQAQAETLDQAMAEQPMEIIINVIDMNDNRPQFTQNPFLGRVPEDAPKGFEFLRVEATDRDEPGQDSSEIRYRIQSQEPATPRDMFFINPITGGVQVNTDGLDRESQQQYQLVVEAADYAGAGLVSSTQVLITVDDCNDNAPQFTLTTYSGSVPENQQGLEVVRMEVMDADQPDSPAWRSRFRVIQGDSEGLFSISTGSSGSQGILTTAKGLDYESSPAYTLLVLVENEVGFSGPVSTSTATVSVRVEDVNEAPVFRPPPGVLSVSEALAVGSGLVVLTASDPDLHLNQTITYWIQGDRAGWLDLNETTGQLLVGRPLDRESSFLIEGTYTVLILAADNAEVPATGTGTLVIHVEDVNDNIPTIDQRSLLICTGQSESQELLISDPDGPGFSWPFRAELLAPSRTDWDVHMNHNMTGVLVSVRTVLRTGEHNVTLRVSDSAGLHQDIPLRAQVCDCTGSDIVCHEKLAALGTNETLGLLAGVFALLLLLLLLLLFLRKRRSEKTAVLLQEEEDTVRDNIYNYDEQGGGEEDQDFNPLRLHCDITNPPFDPLYLPRPVDQKDIGEFIDNTLQAEDRAATAPPYDTVLVFHYEGQGSAAGSLSSLPSSSSGEDQDYQRLAHWGPSFTRLALLYSGEDRED